MKKNLTKLIIIFLLLIIIVPTSSAAIRPFWLEDANKNIAVENLLTDPIFNAEYEKTLIAEYGENYKDIFARNTQAAENAQKIVKFFPTSKSGEVTFPEYIGGLYINNNENLVIQVIKNAIPTSKNEKFSIYNDIISLDKTAKIEYVESSYAELNALNKKITEYFLENVKKSNISAVYIDVIENTVVVELEKCDNEEIKSFKKSLIDSPLITFQKATKGIVKTATYNAGAALNAGAGGTIGYRAKLGSTNGFVTAGHAVMYNGNTLGSYGTVKKWQDSGKVDAAWVQSTHTFTNNLASQTYPTVTLNTLDQSSYATVGLLVGKVGNSTKGQTGRVQNTSWSGTIGTTAYTQLIETNIYNNCGDSGGPAFTMVSPATVLGISTAGYCPGNKAFIVRADNIKAAFGITRY